MADALVIGAGPNGLVAANLLAEKGLDVLVLEAEESPGGAVRTEPLTGDPEFLHETFSGFYPFAVASPAMQRMELERWGVRWRRAPNAVAHPDTDGSCPAIHGSPEETAAALDSLEPGDGDRWLALYAKWRRLSPHLTRMLATPLPPVRAALRMATVLRGDLPRYARFLLLPARRLAEESLSGAAARRLLVGHVSHADLSPEAAPSGAFAVVLAGLGQQYGFPVPEGGGGRITDALVRRLAAHGGELRCGAPVDQVLVQGGRATGVRLEGGETIAARSAVVADVDAPALYGHLLRNAPVPSRVRDDLQNFEWDAATVKVDWALNRPIPWAADEARDAATVHVGSTDELTMATAELATGRVPGRPVLVLGQYAAADPTHAPDGADTAWAYIQVPRRPIRDADGGDLDGSYDEELLGRLTETIEERIEALAPGFRDSVRGRHLLGPVEMERRNRNLVGGAMHGGTTQLHQQGPFRPLPGLGRPETPIRGLYLGSSSAHPGGGVHGGPGYNAARAALRPTGILSRRPWGS